MNLEMQLIGSKLYSFIITTYLISYEFEHFIVLNFDIRFALYKLPRIEGHQNYNVANGTGYVYITSDTVKNGWTLSKFNISHPESIPGKTLDCVYSKKDTNDVNVSSVSL